MNQDLIFGFIMICLIFALLSSKPIIEGHGGGGGGRGGGRALGGALIGSDSGFYENNYGNNPLYNGYLPFLN